MKPLLLTIFIVFVNVLSAQKVWDLGLCIDYALSHRAEVLQQTVNANLSDKQLQYSKLNILPSVELDVAHNWKHYKSYDQTADRFEEVNPAITEVGIYGKIGLFNSFYNYNTIRMYKYLKLKSHNQLEQIKNNIRLSVLTSYTNCQFYQENYQLSLKQKQLLIEQKRDFEILLAKGEKSELDLLEIEARILNENVKVSQALNKANESAISLKKAIEFPDSSQFTLEEVDIPSDIIYSLPTTDSIYKVALVQLPDMQMYNNEMKAYNHRISSIRSQYYPNLYLTGSLSSGINSIASNPSNPQSDYSNQTQFKDNFLSVMGLQLTIPLYSKHEVRKKVVEEQANLSNIQIQKQKALSDIFFEIENIRNNINTYGNNYEALKQTVDSYRKIYELTEKQYNLGVITFLEYITAKNNLEESEIELLKNKYNLLYFLKLVDFYLGKPLTF